MAADGPRGAEPAAQEPRVLVLFRLAGEDYGIDVGCVREIITWQQPTRVPRTPPFVEGIINLRGHIIPVLDLRRRLGLPEGERERSTRIVVVELGTTVVGLVVDAVSEVVRLPAGTIEPPAEVLAVDASFIEGIARHGDRLILVLQPAKVLAPAEWQAVQAVQAGQPVQAVQAEQEVQPVQAVKTAAAEEMAEAGDAGEALAAAGATLAGAAAGVEPAPAAPPEGPAPDLAGPGETTSGSATRTPGPTGPGGTAPGIATPAPAARVLSPSRPPSAREG